MPIKGWTTGQGPRLPRLGTISLGYKDEQKNCPVAVDYFVLPEEVQKACEDNMGITDELKQLELEKQTVIHQLNILSEEEKNERAEEFIKIKEDLKTRFKKVKEKKKIRELDIVLPSEDIDEIMPAWLKRYGKTFGLICRGDGETASVNASYLAKNPGEYNVKHVEGSFFDQEGEELEIQKSGGRKWVQIKCPYEKCEFKIAGNCREVAILSVILYKVPGVLGVYSLDTGSFNSYQNIKNSIEMLKAMLGRVSFIPLKLKVRMQEVNPQVEKNGNVFQVKRKVPVLYMDMGDYTLENVIQMAKDQKLTATALALPPANTEVEVEPPDEDQKPELLYLEQEPPVETTENHQNEVPQTPSNPPNETPPQDAPQFQDDPNAYHVKNARPGTSPSGTPYLRLALEKDNQVLEALLPNQEDPSQLIGKKVKANLMKSGTVMVAQELQVIA